MSINDMRAKIRDSVRAAEEQKRRAAEEQSAREEDAKRRRFLNEGAIDQCIKQVIDPVLESAAQELAGTPYAMDVELIAAGGQAIDARIQSPFKAIKIRLFGTARTQAIESGLEYRGNPDGPSITRQVSIRGQVEEPSGPLALDAITAESVAADVASFIDLVVAS